MADYDSDKCPGCGGQISETTDPETEERWRVDPPVRCHRCTALSIAQSAFEQASPRHPNAVLWSAELK